MTLEQTNQLTQIIMERFSKDEITRLFEALKAPAPFYDSIETGGMALDMVLGALLTDSFREDVRKVIQDLHPDIDISSFIADM